MATRAHIMNDVTFKRQHEVNVKTKSMKPMRFRHEALRQKWHAVGCHGTEWRSLRTGSRSPYETCCLTDSQLA